MCIRDSVYPTGNPANPTAADELGASVTAFENIVILDSPFGNTNTAIDLGTAFLPGTGKDITIRELAKTMKEVIDFNGELFFDTTKPDGSPRKLIDVTRLSNMGWKFNTNLKEGLEMTYKWYLSEGIK